MEQLERLEQLLLPSCVSSYTDLAQYPSISTFALKYRPCAPPSAPLYVAQQHKQQKAREQQKAYNAIYINKLTKAHDIDDKLKNTK